MILTDVIIPRMAETMQALTLGMQERSMGLLKSVFLLVSPAPLYSMRIERGLTHFQLLRGSNFYVDFSLKKKTCLCLTWKEDLPTTGNDHLPALVPQGMGKEAARPGAAI